MLETLKTLNGIIWGIPAQAMILGVGLYLSLCSGWIQFRYLPASLRILFSGHSRDKSSKRAMWTALAATVGTGNIVGVGGAIALGGPGALFWMWVSGLVGMMTKFSEAALAVRFRIRTEAGDYLGGPMYMIQQGLGKRWEFLAGCYSFLGLTAALGVGNAAQVNAVVQAAEQAVSYFGFQTGTGFSLMVGAAIAILAALIFLGGATKIGRITECLVPWASAIYFLLCVFILSVCWQRIPQALVSIIKGAFSPQAVTGGVIGSVFTAMRIGVARGVFTNEAGMGTASIAHAGGSSNPVDQGKMGILEVFLDTIVICTLTGLVILSSGVPISYGLDMGGTLTLNAFAKVCGEWVSVLLAAAMACFAFATILGWGLYGGRCAQFLFGQTAWKWFSLCQILVILISSVLRTETVWLLSELFNGLMAIPNLIVLTALSPELFRLIRYYKCETANAVVGGTYENLN